MATLVNVHQAKTQLSKLLRRVEAGEDVLIGRAGEPVARLTRITPADTAPRPLGTWRGRVTMDDEMAPIPDDEADAFYTSRAEPDDE